MFNCSRLSKMGVISESYMKIELIHGYMGSCLVYDLYTSTPSNITTTLPSIAPGVFRVNSSHENIVSIVNIVSIFQEKNETKITPSD